MKSKFKITQREVLIHLKDRRGKLLPSENNNSQQLWGETPPCSHWSWRGFITGTDATMTRGE